MTEAIRLESVSRTFRSKYSSVEALKNINMSVREGSFCVILGRSGCGKSTLLNIIGLIDSPSGGKYHLFGGDASGLGEGERADIREREIGFVFQKFNLIGNMTALENLEVPLGYRGIDKKTRREAALSALEQVGIADRAQNRSFELSGGEQQRAAIARALIKRPRLLLADEPTGNLDEKNSEGIIGLISSLNRTRGTTVIMATHDRAIAAIADEVFELREGEIAR